MDQLGERRGTRASSPGRCRRHKGRGRRAAITFDVSNAETLKDEARKQAMASGRGPEFTSSEMVSTLPSCVPAAVA
jgi:hypothetical protein